MNHDPYAMCPCGSGKKIKFCCGDILPDISRFFRLLENQRDVAEKLMRDLLTRHPGREVLVAEQWRLLTENEKPEEARTLLIDFLKRHPDHPRGLVWLARLCVPVDGFEKSRRIVHRALQISSRTCSAELALLAGFIGFRMFAAGEFLSAREHLALAVRLADAKDRRSLMSNLALAETDATIPLPLRTPLSLIAVDGSVAVMEQDLRAKKLSHIGCWEPAAILYARMKDAEPQNGAIWYNMALCLAWDGRSKEAAAALHTAAGFLPRGDAAVEAETLAQLLDQLQPDRQYAWMQYRFRVPSLSELHSKLTQAPRFAASRHFDRNPEKSGHPPGVERVGHFELLDRSVADLPEITQLKQLPRSIAEIDLFDIVDSRAADDANSAYPAAVLTVVEDQAQDALAGLLAACARALPEPPETEVIGRSSLDSRDLEENLHRPETISRRMFSGYIRQLQSQIIDQWIDRPLLSLGGLTPRKAVSDPATANAAAAAGMVLFYNSGIQEQQPDLQEIRRKLSVAAPQPLTLPSGQPCTALSIFQLDRLDCTRLNDAQLQEYCIRMSVLSFQPGIKKGFDELLRRPAALEQFGIVRAALARADVARSENDRERAIECFQTAREAAARDRDGFRERMEIEVREIAARLDDPHDPVLITLLHVIRDRYAAKVPEIVTILHSVLLDAGASHLICELSYADHELREPTTLWTPGAVTAPADPAERSLWLPGQS